MLKTLIIVQIFVCFFLVAAVLFQFGKGAETGSFSNSSFEPASSKISGITKLTAFIALLFMVNSLAISRIQTRQSQSSLLEQ